MEEHRIGKHWIRVESDDFMTLSFDGPVSVAETLAVLRVHDAALLAQGRLFVLCHVSQTGGMSPEARAELKRRPRGLMPSYIAYVGAPFAKRVVLDMLLRATSLLAGVQTTHRFFDTEPEARAWLSEMRRIHGQHRPSPSSP